MKLTTKLSIASIICLGILLGIAYAQTNSTQVPQSQAISGRYQIITSPVVARNTFLLDTQTGKIWQLTQFTNLKDEPMAWMIQPRLDTELEQTKWAISQGFK